MRSKTSSSKIGGLTFLIYCGTLIPAIIIGMGVTVMGLRFAPSLEMPNVEASQIPQLRSLTDFVISLVPANPFVLFKASPYSFSASLSG